MRLLTVSECKRVDLCAVAASYGWVIDKTGGIGRATQMRRRDRSDEIVISKQDDGRWVFFARDGRCAGSVIDFVQFFEGGDLGAVRQTISRLVASGLPQPQISSFPTANRGAERPPKNLRSFTSPADRKDAVEYLKSRGLAKSTIEHFRESWAEGPYGNVRFQHSRGGGRGYEYRGSSPNGFSSGGSKGLWCHLPPSGQADTIVVCESGIDAMSHAQLNELPPNAAYVSTAGSFGPRIVAAIIELAQNLCAKILVAFDSDPAGDQMAENVQQAATAAKVECKRDRPNREGVDWNDLLTNASQESTAAELDDEETQIIS